jgi:Rrf2 family nitric oxide-sensitive transcriptional repressor
MRLTRFTDNALRCLTYLGLHESEISTVTDVARRMSMSEDHLMKVVQRLAALGYVETIRGRNGGVRLAQDPAEIRIGTVVRQTEDNLNLVECFDAELNTCPIATSCRLASALDEALSAFLAVLDKYTLRDLLQQPRRLERLLRA